MDMLRMDAKKRKEIIDKLREEFPPFCEIELIRMDDPYSKLQPGDKGLVNHIDDIGTVFVNWRNGSTLGLAYGEDKYKRVTEE